MVETVEHLISEEELASLRAENERLREANRGLVSENELLKEQTSQITSELGESRNLAENWRLSYQESRRSQALMPKEPVPELESVEQAVRLAQQKFGDRINFQLIAKSDTGIPFDNPRQVWDALEWLATTYYDAKTGGSGETDLDMSLRQDVWLALHSGAVAGDYGAVQGVLRDLASRAEAGIGRAHRDGQRLQPGHHPGRFPVGCGREEAGGRVHRPAPADRSQLKPAFGAPHFGWLGVGKETGDCPDTPLMAGRKRCLYSGPKRLTTSFPMVMVTMNPTPKPTARIPHCSKAKGVVSKAAVPKGCVDDNDLQHEAYGNGSPKPFVGKGRHALLDPYHQQTQVFLNYEASEGHCAGDVQVPQPEANEERTQQDGRFNDTDAADQSSH